MLTSTSASRESANFLHYMELYSCYCFDGWNSSYERRVGEEDSLDEVDFDRE